MDEFSYLSLDFPWSVTYVDTINGYVYIKTDREVGVINLDDPLKYQTVYRGDELDEFNNDTDYEDLLSFPYQTKFSYNGIEYVETYSGRMRSSNDKHLFPLIANDIVAVFHKDNKIFIFEHFDSGSLGSQNLNFITYDTETDVFAEEAIYVQEYTTNRPFTWAFMSEYDYENDYLEYLVYSPSGPVGPAVWTAISPIGVEVDGGEFGKGGTWDIHDMNAIMDASIQLYSGDYFRDFVSSNTYTNVYNNIIQRMSAFVGLHPGYPPYIPPFPLDDIRQLTVNTYPFGVPGYNYQIFEHTDFMNNMFHERFDMHNQLVEYQYLYDVLFKIKYEDVKQ
jgi:hypothetical protein